jgi:hypothetical protein
MVGRPRTFSREAVALPWTCELPSGWHQGIVENTRYVLRDMYFRSDAHHEAGTCARGPDYARYIVRV